MFEIRKDSFQKLLVFTRFLIINQTYSKNIIKLIISKFVKYFKNMENAMKLDF